MRNVMNFKINGATCGNCSGKIKGLIEDQEQKSKQSSSCFDRCMPSIFKSTPPKDMSSYITDINVNYNGKNCDVTIKLSDQIDYMDDAENEMRKFLKFKLSSSKFSLEKGKVSMGDNYTFLPQ